MLSFSFFFVHFYLICFDFFLLQCLTFIFKWISRNGQPDTIFTPIVKKDNEKKERKRKKLLIYFFAFDVFSYALFVCNWILDQSNLPCKNRPEMLLLMIMTKNLQVLGVKLLPAYQDYCWRWNEIYFDLFSFLSILHFNTF